MRVGVQSKFKNKVATGRANQIMKWRRRWKTKRLPDRRSGKKMVEKPRMAKRRRKFEVS